MKTGNTGQDDEDQAEPEVERKLSAVAAAPAKNIAIMVVLAILVVVVMWYAFFAPTEEEKKQAAKKPPVEVSNKIATSKPATAEIETKVTALPALPAPPPLVVPTPPPPPVETVEEKPVAAQPVIAPILKDDEEASSKRKAKMSERRKSAIMLAGGGGGGAGGGAAGGGDGKLGGLLGGKKSGEGVDDDNFVPEKTAATQQKVTRLGNMGIVIAQGKIIDAILETAINTDLPGTLRAVISRDVYAEAGKNILIPKGSRLIGSYQADVKVGQKRVNIIWTRVIMPSGLDIAIDSPATDQLGRAGMEGLVDNKFKELFTSAILVSTISTSFAVAAQNLAGSGDSTTSTTTGSNGTTTTSTSDATEEAIAGAVQQIGEVGKTMTQQLINTKPTITIDQGSRVKVFVNRDLLFSNDIAENVRFVR